MGDQSTTTPLLLQEVGDTRNIIICHSPQRQMSKLCIQVPPPAIQGQCPMDELVRSICLRFSSSPTHSICSSEVNTTLSNTILNSPNMAHQTWFTKLLQPSLVPHEKQPLWQHLLTQDQGNVMHPNPKQLNLVIWLM